MGILVPNQDLHQAGIYEIVNHKGFHKYVGQSSDILHRWRCHLHDLRRNKHGNAYLQNAWNRYGERHFQFSVIEFCKPRDLDEREQYWINKLKPEYNIVTDIKLGISYIVNKTTKDECDYDEERDIKRPTWHKFVYGGRKRSG
jgi:group I intron endonuclease